MEISRCDKPTGLSYMLWLEVSRIKTGFFRFTENQLDSQYSEESMRAYRGIKDGSGTPWPATATNDDDDDEQPKMRTRIFFQPRMKKEQMENKNCLGDNLQNGTTQKKFNNKKSGSFLPSFIDLCQMLVWTFAQTAYSNCFEKFCRTQSIWATTAQTIINGRWHSLTMHFPTEYTKLLMET